MKQLKRPLDFQSQITQLKSQGMVVEDDQVAEDILRKTNYYRFTGYALQFRVSPNQSDYIPGTSFNNIYRLYLFDEALRDICRRYIEIAEVYYRTQVSYGFSIVKCTKPPMTNTTTTNISIIKMAIRKLWKTSRRKRTITRTAL